MGRRIFFLLVSAMAFVVLSKIGSWYWDLEFEARPILETLYWAGMFFGGMIVGMLWIASIIVFAASITGQLHLIDLDDKKEEKESQVVTKKEEYEDKDGVEVLDLSPISLITVYIGLDKVEGDTFQLLQNLKEKIEIEYSCEVSIEWEKNNEGVDNEGN